MIRKFKVTFSDGIPAAVYAVSITHTYAGVIEMSCLFQSLSEFFHVLILEIEPEITHNFFANRQVGGYADDLSHLYPGQGW